MMFGSKKLKEWCNGRFALNADAKFSEERYWKLWHELQALKDYLNVEYQEPSRTSGRIVKKDTA